MSSSLNRSVSRLQFYDLFDVALKEYNQKTGIDILTDPLTAALLDCDSSDEVLGILQEQAHAFSQYQSGDGVVQLMRQLKPTVDILLGLSSSGVFGKGFGLVSLMKLICSLWTLIITLQRYLPAKMIFTGFGLLLAVCPPSLSQCCGPDNQILKATKGDSYDTLIEFFECLEHFLDHLKVLIKIPSAMGEPLAKIMVELLGILALATQQVNRGRFSEFVVAGASHLANHASENFTKKLLAESDVQAVLQRLDRLTAEESRMTATQIMEVVCGLFNNMKIVMDGTEMSLDLSFSVLYFLL